MAVLYAAAPLAYLILATAIGVGSIPDSPMFIIWLLGSFGLCIGWNIYYRTRGNSGEAAPVIEFPEPKKAKEVERRRLLPALTGRKQPEIEAADAAVVDGEVISDRIELHPDVLAAMEKVNKRLAEKARAQAEADARARAQIVIAGYRALVHPTEGNPRPKLRDLAPCKAKITRADDFMTELSVRLVDGVEPKEVTDATGALAVQFRRGENDVQAWVNPNDNGDVRVRVRWFNPLAESKWWPGPLQPGKPWGGVPVQIGTREDNTPALLHLPYGSGKTVRKNSSHVLVEGMNGAGKSETMLSMVGEGCSRCGVVFFGIDTGKVLQTFGPIMPAIDWMATDADQARLMIKALAEQIIPERGRIFGAIGASEWTQELWDKYRIPYIVVIIEEGGIIFEILGKRFVEVMLLARSLGISVWGSIQRAHHGMIDTNARAQFSEVMTFGMAEGDDVFCMPEDMQKVCAPEQWRNSEPGMHYHYTPLKRQFEDQIMPQRSWRMDRKNEGLLRQVTEEYGPKMARPEESLIRAADRLENAYSERETGLDVERRLKAEGGIPLDDRSAVEAATAEQMAMPPQREAVAPADDQAALEAARPTRERITILRNPYALDDEPAEAELVEDDYSGGEIMYDDKGRPTGIRFAGDEDVTELADVDAELEGYDDLDEEEEYAASIKADDDEYEDTDVEGFADAEHALSAIPQDPRGILSFEDGEEDWEPSDSREGAKRNLLRVFASLGPGVALMPHDLYDHPLIPYVDRSKGWLRGEFTALAEQGVYLYRCEDPNEKDLFGQYVITENIRKVPVPALEPSGKK
jgi:hypothetical protein